MPCMMDDELQAIPVTADPKEWAERLIEIFWWYPAAAYDPDRLTAWHSTVILSVLHDADRALAEQQQRLRRSMLIIWRAQAVVALLLLLVAVNIVLLLFR